MPAGQIHSSNIAVPDMNRAYYSAKPLLISCPNLLAKLHWATASIACHPSSFCTPVLGQKELAGAILQDQSSAR